MNRWTFMFLCVVLSIGGNLHAQTCADAKTLTGTVLDPSGAAVVGAQVHLDVYKRQVLVRTRTPEAVLRTMLAQDAALSGLEVRAAALEDAFLALTNQTNSNAATL